MTLLTVFVVLVVARVALRGLPAHQRRPWWVRTAVFWSLPLRGRSCAEAARAT